MDGQPLGFLSAPPLSFINRSATNTIENNQVWAEAPDLTPVVVLILIIFRRTQPVPMRSACTASRSNCDCCVRRRDYKKLIGSVVAVVGLSRIEGVFANQLAQVFAIDLGFA